MSTPFNIQSTQKPDESLFAFMEKVIFSIVEDEPGSTNGNTLAAFPSLPCPHRCVVQEHVVDEILEDIYEYFTEKMRPPREESAEMDLSMDFDQVPLSAESNQALSARNNSCC